MAVYSVWGQAARSPSFANPGGSFFTYGLQVTLSASAALTGIWFYSGASDGALPLETAVYNVATKTLVSGTDNAAPSWSGSLGSGWIKVTYDGSVTLDTRADGYIPVIRWSNGGGAGVVKGFRSAISYPVTSGILTAGTADVYGTKNAPFASTAGANLIYPNVDGGGGFDWLVDLEVTTAAPPGGAPDRHHHRTPTGRPGQARIGGRGGVR